jgi:hypothetical protein
MKTRKKTCRHGGNSKYKSNNLSKKNQRYLQRFTDSDCRQLFTINLLVDSEQKNLREICKSMTQGTVLDIVFDYFFPDELFPTESELPPNGPLPSQYKGKCLMDLIANMCIGYGVVKTFTIFKPFMNAPITTPVHAQHKRTNQQLTANSPPRKSAWLTSNSTPRQSAVDSTVLSTSKEKSQLDVPKTTDKVFPFEMSTAHYKEEVESNSPVDSLNILRTPTPQRRLESPTLSNVPPNKSPSKRKRNS